ncbi:hypothetical protein M438DRAFT_364549 [Aureobasidium pullulans EXF-150]|uniref:Uncharacterized protein n=1 Tax=Aureobasidium pullulans EXF-150 TaxID=1043002 RepID=A0A074XU12_AURPU|nr:uncharacterized protein M438DRAFT_364549 [Aureobasidium pullulans EXF-150]KEQ85462.1 hypothetical protein M438DRAFT_364549 [Aureobasidium pullulans EXF-150]
MVGPHYISQEMASMAEHFKTGGLGRLAVKITELDQKYAPYSNISATPPTTLSNAGMVCLAQVSPELMISLLDNTLVQKWKTGAIVINDWHRIPRAVRGENEPAIYVNYFAAADGTGLSIAEYQVYLEAMSAAMLGKNAMVGGKKRDIIRKIDVYYKKRTGEQTPFSRLLLNAHLDHFEFMRYQNKVINAATKAGALEIRFPGEVRWSFDVDQCIKKHQKLQGNELLLRLTMCVVGVLWPDKGFELSSFALFRVISWAQVHMFESIGSHLINSYAGYGGFNFSTSGVTISSAARASPATWEHIANQYHQVLVYSTIASEQHGLELQKELLSMEGATFAAKAHIKTQQLATSLKLVLDQFDGSGEALLDRTTLEGIAQSLVLLFDTPDAMTKKCYDELVGLKRRLGSMAKAATERSPGA